LISNNTPPCSYLKQYYRHALANLLITHEAKTRDTSQDGQLYPMNSILWRRPWDMRAAAQTTPLPAAMPFAVNLKNSLAILHCWLTVLSLALTCSAGNAESSQQAQFLPEVDAYLKVNPDLRVSFQAKDTREGGDPTQAEIGPSAEFYLKPLVRLKEITVFDLDDAKARPLVLTAGYRYLSAPGKPGTNRIPIAVTSHLPLTAKLLLTDRNRADLDWSNGSFTWRYRNMLSLERTVAIRSYHLIPYASAEIYYESQYSKVSTTEFYTGTHLPLGKHLQLTPYYEHQNNTGKHPNQQVHGLGLTLNIYLSRKAK
jgi:hypothetical protein